MTHHESLSGARSASRRTLVGTSALLALLAGAIGWSSERIRKIDSGLAAANDAIDQLNEEASSLSRMKHTLVDTPDGGVRVTKIRVPNIGTDLYDHFLWVDASQRSDDAILEARYQFPGREAFALNSSNPAAGFAVFFRAPRVRCPDSAIVTLTLADRSTRTYERDLCQARMIGQPAGVP